jgi:hypothetical protein
MVALLTGELTVPGHDEEPRDAREHRGDEADPMRVKRRERERSGVDGVGRELAGALAMARWQKNSRLSFTSA